MFKNYLTIAFRNLIRNKVFSIINISGLALGMACVILIALYIQHELSYDQHHSNVQNIYRVLRETRSSDGKVALRSGTSGPLAEALKKEFPEIVQTVRRMSWGGVWVSRQNQGFYQRFCWADPSILEIFDLPLTKGDSKTALLEPHTIILTEEMAQKYFGSEDPIGQVISVDNRYFGGEYTITGIAANVPSNSQFSFDFLSASMHQEFPKRYWHHWRRTLTYRPIITYILLPDGYDASQLEQKLPAFIEQHMGEDIKRTDTYYLQPFNRTYLYSNHDYGPIISTVDSDYPWHGDIRYVYFLGAIGLFILAIACINFMNLTTARAVIRMREIGLRKVIGAHRLQLVKQFLGESILLAYLSLLLSLVLVELALPWFNNLTGKPLVLNIHQNALLTFGLPAFAFIVGMLAGCYPALFLSKYQPVDVMKGIFKGQQKGIGLRKGLVVFQFAITVFLIVSSAVVYRQLNFIANKELGFEDETVITLPLFQTDRTLNPTYRQIKRAFLSHPNILSTAASLQTMAGKGELMAVKPEGASQADLQMYMFAVDEDFFNTYQIPLITGRSFSAEIARDNRHSVILNEAAVKSLGWTNPIGKTFHYWGVEHLVIGVVKDFHFHSLRNKIAPLFFQMWVDKWNYLSLRIRTDNLPETLGFLETTWKKYIPTRPFEFAFVNDTIAKLYQRDQKIALIVRTFAVLALLVASLGLFGLSSFTVERRIKELGIRKVLGASVPSLMVLLSVEFSKLVALSNAIAWPVAYLILSRWLQNFAYRIDLGINIFALCGISVFIIALLTVSYQAFKAAIGNPIDALRQE